MTLRTKVRRLYRGVFRRVRDHLSPNWSSRNGAKVRAAVVHTTESGDDSYEAICDYLSRRGVEASAHYVVDALPRRDGAKYTRVSRLVPEDKKAWTSRSANPYTVNYELIGRASRTREEWTTKYIAQLRTLASLIAEDVVQYDLPIRRDFPGILGHGDLDREGFPNDHTDPGAGFPWRRFLRMVENRVEQARKYYEIRYQLRDGEGETLHSSSRIPGGNVDSEERLFRRFLDASRDERFREVRADNDYVIRRRVIR